VTPEREEVGGEAAARAGQVRQLVLVMFIALVAFSSFEATFSLLTKARFDLSESATYGVFFVIGIALVFVQGGLIHPVESRLGEATTIRLGLASNAVGLLLVAVDAGWVALAPGLLLLVLGQGLLMPTLTSAVAGRARTDRRGATLGFQQSAGGLGRIVGPILGGALFQHVGVASPYVVGATLALLALAVVPGGASREVEVLVTDR
jgi:predicted MFS family arabinose efflux permease